MRPTRNPDESFSRWRQRMLAETSRYIEWGLKNPDKVEWIPTHPIGRAGFSERVRTLFWALVAQNDQGPDDQSSA